MPGEFRIKNETKDIIDRFRKSKTCKIILESIGHILRIGENSKNTERIINILQNQRLFKNAK